MIERPKYIEYRHQRDRIASFEVKRTVEVKIERPASALARMVGKKTTAKQDSYDEEWVLELRTTDVMPDYSAPVKTQVTQATRTAKGESLPYVGGENPTTEFLNETVDRYGMLSAHHGSLPTPHLLLFPEEPVKKGEEWERSRHELVPISGPDGQVKAYEARPVTYVCRVDEFGDDGGVEFADVAVSGFSQFGGGDDGPSQTYTVVGRVRFAIRDGHTITAKVVRSMATSVDKVVVTRSASEKFSFMSRGTEQTVGGMRI